VRDRMKLVSRSATCGERLVRLRECQRSTHSLGVVPDRET
jgi:hypothetical protein